MKRVIAVLNQKGGVGKTTSAINVAAYAAKAGKKVLLIDLDPQGNATSGLGVDKLTLTKTMYEAMIGEVQLADYAIKTQVDNLWLVPTNAELAGVEVSLANAEKRELRLRNFLAHSTQEFDLVFIDCPPSLGLLTVNALTASSDVLIPVQTEYYALEGIGQLVQVIQRVQHSLNPTLQILGVMLTMYDNRTSLSNQVKAEVEKVFGDLVFKTTIPRNVRLAEAPSHGRPIMDYEKWSKGARAYKNLTKEVLTRVG
jgi:chromosome partitioning protein